MLSLTSLGSLGVAGAVVAAIVAGWGTIKGYLQNIRSIIYRTDLFGNTTTIEAVFDQLLIEGWKPFYYRTHYISSKSRYVKDRKALRSILFRNCLGGNFVMF